MGKLPNPNGDFLPEFMVFGGCEVVASKAPFRASG